MYKVAVIGCNSFTGGYVVDELLAAGEYQVLGIDREEKGRLFLPYVQNDLRRFRFAQMDVNKDMADLLALLQSEQPDYVMNLAALSEVAPSWEHPEQWMQTNVVALTILVDGLRHLPVLKKFVQISTPEVYGSVAGRVQEDAALKPSTPYAVSKAAFDLLLLAFVKQYAFPAVLMRAANVYGAHQQLFKIVPRTIIYEKLGRKLPLHGGGKATRAFIHGRDVARAYVAALTLGKVGEAYHVAPETTVTIRELVQRICDLVGEDISAVVEDTPARPGHDAVYSLDASKAKRDLRWQPEVTLSAGLAEVIAWVDTNWAEIREESLEYVHRA
ncbi:MAG TPA: GDP-mannose 4,6-dehydratase [Candidatus Andersenbacteria bacterium]|nr:GDP-mannose 4,6-dehydratase [Candidatus Andersenbacteria bacterium]